MDLAIRSVVLYGFVFFLTRVVGRRELSSLQPFDLILLIVLGDSIQQGLTQDDYSVIGALIVVGTIATLRSSRRTSPTGYRGCGPSWTEIRSSSSRTASRSKRTSIANA